MSQSFVESAADVGGVREAARSLGCEPFVIAKIERARALERVDEILAAADGLMIARGDLGVEVPIERIAVLQKSLVRKAVVAGKPVITATQMLESMTHSRQPSRAESTDVANAILDGTDGVMLSAESASGTYPVESVATLARIAAATEPHRSRFELWEHMRTLPQEVHPGLYDLIAVAAEAVMEFGTSAAVVVPTGGGQTARSIARFRLPVWIATGDTERAGGSAPAFLLWGAPGPTDKPGRGLGRVHARMGGSHGLSGTMAVLLYGPSADRRHANHAMELVDLGTPG